MNFRQSVRAASPDFILRIYRKVREHLDPATLSAPVAQMYINDGDIHTLAGLNNFISFLSAESITSGTLHLTLYDAEGKLLLEQSSPLKHFESRFVDIKALLEQQGLISTHGLISMAFIPKRLHLTAYKKLGILTSQFFMFYQGGRGSVAMVHPSSTLDPKSPPSTGFITNQAIETQGLDSIWLYQCNPSSVAHEITVGLEDAETHEIVSCEDVQLPPLGVRKIVFAADRDFQANGNALRIFTSALPTANSKPMLCRHYADGRFSMSHS
jgi:hypothetical protein